MALPQTVRVKLSSEVAEAISITPVVLQELPVRELVEHLLGIAGKDESRIREILLRGALVSGASRFRWAGWDADVASLRELLATFPDADPARPFAAAACIRAILRGGRHAIEIPREAAARRSWFQRKTFWDLLMEVVGASGRLLLPRPRRPLPPPVHPRRNRKRPRRRRRPALQRAPRADPVGRARASGVVRGALNAGWQAEGTNATYFLACQTPSMDCGAGLYPARRFSTGAGRVTNPPQIAKPPHNSRRIPGFGKSMWHWALSPANRFLHSPVRERMRNYL